MKTSIRLFTYWLLVQSLVLGTYTCIAFMKEGTDLFGVFLKNLVELGWNGQFNLDFSGYLLISGAWIIWRNGLSLSNLLLAAAATIIGFNVFAPYLAYLIFKENGNIEKVLLGKHRLSF